MLLQQQQPWDLCLRCFCTSHKTTNWRVFAESASSFSKETKKDMKCDLNYFLVADLCVPYLLERFLAALTSEQKWMNVQRVPSWIWFTKWDCCYSRISKWIAAADEIPVMINSLSLCQWEKNTLGEVTAYIFCLTTTFMRCPQR